MAVIYISLRFSFFNTNANLLMDLVSLRQSFWRRKQETWSFESKNWGWKWLAIRVQRDDKKVDRSLRPYCPQMSFTPDSKNVIASLWR